MPTTYFLDTFTAPDGTDTSNHTSDIDLLSSNPWQSGTGSPSLINGNAVGPGIDYRQCVATFYYGWHMGTSWEVEWDATFPDGDAMPSTSAGTGWEIQLETEGSSHVNITMQVTGDGINSIDDRQLVDVDSSIQGSAYESGFMFSDNFGPSSSIFPRLNGETYHTFRLVVRSADMQLFVDGTLRYTTTNQVPPVVLRGIRLYTKTIGSKFSQVSRIEIRSDSVPFAVPSVPVDVDSGTYILYQFAMGNTTWRYTSAEEKLTVNGFEWLPVAISHDDINQTGEPLTEMLTINASSSIGPAQLFMSAVPPRGVMLTMFERHELETDLQVIYVGEISQVGFPLPGTARIRCETISASMGREGLRLAWQRSCPYAVYDPTTCKLDMSDYAQDFTILLVSGRTLTVEFDSVVSDGLLNDGFMQWDNPLRGVEYLSIDTHTAGAGGLIATLSINGDPSDVVIGARGTAFPTCALTPTACQDFGNYDNYGGHVDMPGKSPFDGLDSPFF